MYHNTTAHYNAYFIALEEMNQVETAIDEAFNRNYDRVLPVFPDIDSSTINSQKEKLEDCIKKASLAIQRHENSAWVDDSYLLIGKSWFYQAEFTNAIETFKYIYTQSEEDNTRHKALIALMRTYIHYNEFNNAVAVSDVLLKEGPNKENLKDYYVTMAYLYQLRKDDDNLVQNLSEAVKLEKDRNALSHYFFILGQVYQKLGFEAEAYNFYRRTLKSNPDFELSFYTKLNMAQVTELGNKVDIKKIRGYFKKLLKDDKNREFKDRIYYEMARFELKHENYEVAVEHLKSSIRESLNNQKQKAYSYLKLGELYYDHYHDYRLAQAYYDSTINVLPTEDERYQQILQRQQILNDFVTQIYTIQLQDSLLQLAEMDEEALDKLLEEVLAEKERIRQEEEKAQRQQQRLTTLAQGPANKTFANPFGIDPDSQTEGARWYFYNPAAISSGISAFKSRWGNRPLEDNWRRTTKESLVQFSNVTPAEQEADTLSQEPGEQEETAQGDEKQQLMASIPFTDEEKGKALAMIEEAYFNLGNIYHFKLLEQQNAVETFEKLLERFPSSEFAPEVLYQLYLIFKDTDTPKSEVYKKKLIDTYPETVYANLALNPNFLQENSETSERLKQLYEIAYDYYTEGDYNQAGLLVSRALEQYPDNDFSDHLRLLHILIAGKVEGQYKYQFALQEFIEQNPESSLKPYAEKLLTTSQGFEIAEAKRSGARYSEYLDYPHLFVILYKNTNDLAANLPNLTDQYLQETYPEVQLNVGNLVFNSEQSILLINKFEDRKEAKAFIERYNKGNKIKEALGKNEVTSFIITEDNFQLFYQSKRLDDYLNFYKAHYQ